VHTVTRKIRSKPSDAFDVIKGEVHLKHLTWTEHSHRERRVPRKAGQLAFRTNRAWMRELMKMRR